MGCGQSQQDSEKNERKEKMSAGQRSACYGEDEPKTPTTPKEGGSKLNMDYSSMIDDLAQVNVVQLAGCIVPQGRKMCIGSVTTGKQPDYTEKPIEKLGDLAFLSERQSFGLGCVCKKGLKPQSPNQDSWMVLEMEREVSIYGVFDGHGQMGHKVSHFVSEYLPKLIISDPRFRTDEMPMLLKEAFEQAQGMVITADRNKKLKAQLSGTTVTVVVHEHAEKRLTFAHCADSTACLGEWTDSSHTKLKATHATRDHKPDLADEKKRIEKAGGDVKFDGHCNHRVYAKGQGYPGLNMSRCMGDLKGHFECGLSSTPELDVISISPEHHVLLVCSDGVWEFITPQEAVDFVGKQPPEKAGETAEALTKMAWDRWMKEEKGQVVDDITAIVVYLNVGGGAAAAVVDAQVGA